MDNTDTAGVTNAGTIAGTDAAGTIAGTEAAGTIAGTAAAGTVTFDGAVSTDPAPGLDTPPPPPDQPAPMGLGQLAQRVAVLEARLSALVLGHSRLGDAMVRLESMTGEALNKVEQFGTSTLARDVSADVAELAGRVELLGRDVASRFEALAGAAGTARPHSAQGG